MNRKAVPLHWTLKDMLFVVQPVSIMIWPPTCEYTCCFIVTVNCTVIELLLKLIQSV
jgi:hypothetical protein